MNIFDALGRKVAKSEFPYNISSANLNSGSVYFGIAVKNGEVYSIRFIFE